jgi:polyisoprenoid-binding protein YceI
LANTLATQLKQKKMRARQIPIVIISLLFFQMNILSAQSPLLKNFKIAVKGTSTMHDWESQVEKLECKASFTIEGNRLIDIKEAQVKIPVKSIKSEKGKMMDNKTFDAFNYQKHPSIIFLLSGKKISASNNTIDLKGNLSMAGTTKPIDLVANYKVLSNGDLQITGSKKIRMTDFHMEPPTAMMGTIKVGDEVIIGFDIVLSGTHTVL